MQYLVLLWPGWQAPNSSVFHIIVGCGFSDWYNYILGKPIARVSKTITPLDVKFTLRNGMQE